MAPSPSGLLRSGLRALALPLALTLLVFGPISCSDDPSPTGNGDPVACDAIENPCPRTQVCEGGACEPAPRCPDGEESACAEGDKDGDPLFCEFTFCVEACQPGGLHCNIPQFRCDPRSHTCVLDDGFCESSSDCASDLEVCVIPEGKTRGVCRLADPCSGDKECEDSTYGGFCHPTDRICVSCFEDDHCEIGARTVCNLDTYACDVPPPIVCLADIECCPPGVDCEKTCDVSRDPAVCREGLQCFQSYDCLEERGRYCFDDDDDEETSGQCRTKCDQGGSCPNGYTCNPGGECELETCTSDADCDVAAGEQCVEFANGTSRCVRSDCEEDEDCENFANGGKCEELIPGFGRCTDGECLEQGQADTCREDDWVCDFDVFAGADFIHCQAPCGERTPPQCFLGTNCDVLGGSGLCLGGPGDIGCMSSESCIEDDECCDRGVQAQLPRCGGAACGVDSCRSTAQCADGQLCVDDNCVPVEDRPVVCEESSDCAGRQVCALAGGCELVAPCQVDGDCPGRLTCNPESGRCNECDSDSDCLAAGIGVVCGDAPSGRYKKCLEPSGGFCQDDGQCTGIRVCNNGFCEPDPELICEDDWMDRAYASKEALESRPSVNGNHSPVNAAPIGAQIYTGLVLCDSKDDWFKVSLEQGQDIEVTLVYDVNGGTGADLSLELREGNTLYGRSDSIGGVERVGINGAPFAGEYLIRVSGVPGARATPYQLTLKVGEICVDDPLEGPEGNEQTDQATPIEPGLIPDLILCAQDGDGSAIDVYRLDLAAGTNMTIIVGWDEADGRVQGSLNNADNEVIDDADNVTKQEFGGSVRWDVAEWEGGSLFIRLAADAGNDSEIRYDIRVLAECSVQQREELCGDAPDLPLVPGPLDPITGQPQFYEATVSGNTCTDVGIGNCFAGSCDPLGDEHVARERIWKLDTTAAPFNGTQPVDVSVRYSTESEDFRGTVSFRTGCADDATEASCRLDPRRPYRQFLPPGVHNILVDGAGEDCGPFELDLNVRPLDIEFNKCDTCVSFAPIDPNGIGEERLPPSVCDLGNPLHPALALATWANLAGDGGENYNFVAQLRHSTSLSNPNQFEGGVASCINVRNAGIAPDTVYEITTPEGAADGCRFTARLAAENFVGGLALRDSCPAQEELACKFDNNFSAKVLFVEELEPGTYTIWIKGSGALQHGSFVLDLQCTRPGVPPPGDTCQEPVEFDLDPLLDHRGFELGHEKLAVVGQNIGATDQGDYGAGCRAEACNPNEDDDCGGDIWYEFNQPNLASVWVAELDADYPATFTLMRGVCGNLEEVACGNTGEAIQLFDLPAGDYFLVVDAEGADARGGHQLDITAIEQDVPQPSNDACQGEYADPRIRAEAIEFGIGRRVQIDGTTFGANHDRNPQLCGDPNADATDVVFVYTADEEHQLEARIFGGFNHNLYVRRADCLDGPEVICAVGDIELTNLPPGTYYLFVDGLSVEQAGGFTLQVTFEDAGGVCRQGEEGDPGEGGNCFSAQELEFDDVLHAVFRGNNSGCQNNESPPDGCGQPGEEGIDTVYYFDLPVASHIDLFVDAPFDEVAYLRRADDAAACALAADLECRDNDPARFDLADPLPAGRYYLIIDAEFADANLAGSIDIDLRAVPIDDPPANDTCEEVRTYQDAWLRHIANPDGVDLVLPEVCLEDGNPNNVARCGLLDPLLAANDGRVVVGGNTAAALPNYDVREFDADDDATCDQAGGLRAADQGKDLVYVFTVADDQPSSLTVQLNNIDLGNGLIYIRQAANDGACGGQEAVGELWCADEPALLEIERIEPGTYFLIVDGFNEAARGQFTLDVNLQVLPRRPPNDHCHPDVANQNAELIDLAIDGDTATGQVRGSLTAAADDYRPETCGEQFGLGAGPDVVYAIDLPFDNNEVSIEVDAPRVENEFAPWNLIAYLRSGDCHDGPEIPGGCGVTPPDPRIGLTFENRRFLPGNQTIFLVVDGLFEDDDAPSFDLRVEITEVVVEVAEGDSCDADDIPVLAFEGGNGAPDEQVREYNGASTLGNSNVTASANCGGGQGRDRVHLLTVPHDSLVDVTFTPDGWGGSVSIRGVDGCDDVDTEITCGGNQIGPFTLNAGDYWIWVDGNSSDDWGPYTLQVHKTPAIRIPYNDTCALVAEYDELWNDGDPQADFPAICVDDPSECGVVDFADIERAVLANRLNDQTTDEESGSCGGLGGRDRIYKITLDDPSFLTIRATFTVPRIFMYLRADCAVAGSEVIVDPDSIPPAKLCGEARRGSETILSTPQLPVGDYYLIVDGRAADQLGDYTILVSRNAAPPNDLCDGALSLDVGRGGQATVSANTAVAGDHYAAECGGAGAEDLVYHFNLEVPADLHVRVPTSFEGVVYMTSGACDTADADVVVEHCVLTDPDNPGTIDVNNLREGDYWLHVDGRVAGDNGVYSISVETVPLTPPNNECVNAEFLQLNEPNGINGTTIGATDDDPNEEQADTCETGGSPDVFYSFSIELDPADFSARLRFGSYDDCTQDYAEECPEGQECCALEGEICPPLGRDGNYVGRHCETAEPEMDYVLAIRRGECGGAAECGTPATSLVVSQLPEADYTLVVDGGDPGGRADFVLVARTERPGNSECVAVAELGHPYGFVVDADPDAEDDDVPTQWIEGTLVGAGSSYIVTSDGCTEDNTGGTRDVVFELNLPEALDFVDVTVSSRHFNPTWWATFDGCPSGEPYGCWIGDGDEDGDGVFESNGRLTRLQAGRHFLYVDAGDADALGDFTIKVEAGPVLQPPVNVDCANAEIVTVEYSKTIPILGEAELTGSTIGASGDYAPAACEGFDANGLSLLAESADVVYCMVMTTNGVATTATITPTPRPGALPFSPVAYLYLDLGGYTDSGVACSEDFEAADCGEDGCCEEDHPFCKDFEGDGDPTCRAAPTCDEIDPEYCGVGNPVNCGTNILFNVGEGGFSPPVPGGGEPPPDEPDEPQIFKYYLVLDGLGLEGDFDLLLESVSQIDVCDGPLSDVDACDAEVDACCQEGLVCRCLECGDAPDIDAGEEPDVDCCDDDADNPPACRQCRWDTDCPGGEICTSNNLCLPDCAEPDAPPCVAPTFCLVPEVGVGECVRCENTDPPAGGDCADDDDCLDIDDRAQFCGPTGKCSECGLNPNGNNDLCAADNSCVACAADDHCEGVEDEAGVALEFCSVLGECSECRDGDACEDNDDCPDAGTICGAFGVCVNCAEGEFCSAEGTCADCANNADCDEGEACEAGRCAPPREVPEEGEQEEEGEEEE